MISPTSPALLAVNPNFERLHSRLKKDILDQDASTRSFNLSHLATCDQLEAERISAVRDKLLTTSFLDLTHNSGLPRELRELVFVVVSYVSDASTLGLVQEENDLLSEDIAQFHDRLPEVSDLLSQRLSSQQNTLRDLAAVSQDAIFESQIPSLGAAGRTRAPRRDEQLLHELVDSHLSHLDHLRSHVLPTSLYDTITTLISLLRSQAGYLHHLIRYLEQRKHGADSRHLAAKAHFLSTVAQGLQAKTEVSYLEQRRDLYSPELVNNLEQRMNDLDEAGEKLEQRKRKLQAALAEYDDTGLDVMKTLGKRYGVIEKETQEVKGDIERLSTNEGGGSLSANH